MSVHLYYSMFSIKDNDQYISANKILWKALSSSGGEDMIDVPTIPFIAWSLFNKEYELLYPVRVVKEEHRHGKKTSK